jgi:hypothetical protein
VEVTVLEVTPEVCFFACSTASGIGMVFGTVIRAV